MTNSDTVIDRLVADDTTGLRELLNRPGRLATSTRDRQLLAIARAHLADDIDLLEALVSDHLVDHPDSRLAAWLITRTDTRSAQ